MQTVLEEKFYVGEGGFAFSIRTGIDMTNLADGEIKGVIQRPNGSLVDRVIPIAKVTDVTTGTVDFDVLDTDFSMPGYYKVQVYTKDADAALARPSHIFSFEVVDNLVKDVENLFP